MDILIESLLAGLGKIKPWIRNTSLLFLVAISIILGLTAFISSEKGEFAAALLNISAFVLGIAFVSGILLLAKAGDDVAKGEFEDIKKEFQKIAKETIGDGIEDFEDIIHRSRKFDETYSCIGKIKGGELHLQAHKFANNGKIMELQEDYDENTTIIGLSIWMEDKEKLSTIADSLSKKKIKLLKTKNPRMKMIVIEQMPELKDILPKILNAVR